MTSRDCRRPACFLALSDSHNAQISSRQRKQDVVSSPEPPARLKCNPCLRVFVFNLASDPRTSTGDPQTKPKEPIRNTPTAPNSDVPALTANHKQRWAVVHPIEIRLREMTLGTRACIHCSGTGINLEPSKTVSLFGRGDRCPMCMGSGRSGWHINLPRKWFLLRLSFNLMIAGAGVVAMATGHPAVGIAAVVLMPIVTTAVVRR